MATYLRFTATINDDINKGFSYLKLPSLKKPRKLDGLCAFRFDTWLNGEFDREMTDTEILNEIKKIASHQHYLNCSVAALIDADYIEGNINGEGSIVKPNYLIKEYILNFETKVD